MAFIYNLTDTWNDGTATWNGIKLAVTNSGSDASSKLLNLTVSGATTASFVVDKSGNLALNGTVNKITMTAPATGATLTLADNSTFITSGAYSSTFTFTGATTLTFPTSGTVTALGNTTTGTGSIVLASSPTLTSPALGTPSSATLTNATGLPISTGVSGLGTDVATALAINVGTNGSFIVRGSSLGTPSSGDLSNCTGYPAGSISGLGAGVATWLATPSSANLASAVTDETGSGSLVFATSPTLVTPILGTPTSVTLTNATGLPLSTGVTGTLPVANGGTGINSFGTGVATALGVNVGSAGAFVVNGGALGTPLSGTLTNATGLPISTGVSGLGAGVATFLATPSSANLASAVTDETGSGALVFATDPVFPSDITVGTASSAQGELILANTSTYTVKLRSSNTTAADYTLTFPAAAPVNGYYLQTDTNGVLSWAAGGGGGGGSPGGSNTQIQFNNTGSFGGDAAFTFVNGTGTATMSLGVASTTSAALKLYNSSSANSVSIASGNNTASWTMTLPVDDGSSGQYLQTDGSGNTSWATVSTGITINTTAISGGTSGRILYDNAGTVGEKAVTGTGDVVLATSPTLITPLLGTPTSGTLTNCTGLPIATGVSGLGTNVATALAVNVGTAGAFVVNGGALGTPSSGTLTSCTGLPVSSGISGLGTGVDTFLATPSSANLASAVTDETGSGALVFANTPTLISPILGTPTSGTLTNCTSIPVNQATGTLPVANGGTGLTSGTSGGVLYYSATGTLASSAALAASSLVIGGGAGAAPSTTTTGAGILTFLGTPSSANLAAAVTDETGSGALVFATSPSLTTPTLGVASATSINKVAITAPATGSTLTVDDGKTLRASNSITIAGTDGKTVTFINSITFAGTDSTTMTFPATSSSIGYLNIPQNSQGGAYALALSDVGKHISISTGGVTVNSGIFSAGDVVTIYNNSGSNQTITQGSVTMYLAGTATTGNRTLAQRGICTVLCVASNTFVISGAGLT